MRPCWKLGRREAFPCPHPRPFSPPAPQPPSPGLAHPQEDGARRCGSFRVTHTGPHGLRAAPQFPRGGARAGPGVIVGVWFPEEHRMRLVLVLGSRRGAWGGRYPPELQKPVRKFSSCWSCRVHRLAGCWLRVTSPCGPMTWPPSTSFPRSSESRGGRGHTQPLASSPPCFLILEPPRLFPLLLGSGPVRHGLFTGMTFCVSAWCLGKLRASCRGGEGVRAACMVTVFGRGRAAVCRCALHGCSSALRLRSPHELLLPGPWPLPVAGLLQGHVSLGLVH